MDNTIFDKFRRFSRILSLYNREQYQLIDRKAWWQQIVFALIFTILLIFVGLLLVTAIWHCFDCNFSIMGTAFAIPVSFVILQLSSVCISMFKDNRKIGKIVNHLQKIIEKRENFACDLGLNCLYLKDFDWCILFREPQIFVHGSGEETFFNYQNSA